MGCRSYCRRHSRACCPASAPVVAEEEVTIAYIPILGVPMLTTMLRDCVRAVWRLPLSNLKQTVGLGTSAMCS